VNITPVVASLSDKPPSLKQAQEFCGGYVQMLWLDDDSQLLVNEDGRLKGLQVNKEASDRWPAWGQLLGNVMHLTGTARWT